MRGEIAHKIASLDEMLAFAEEGLGIAVLPAYSPENVAGTLSA